MHDTLLLIVDIDGYRYFRGILSAHKIVYGAHHSAFAFKAISMALILLEILTHFFYYSFDIFDFASEFQLIGSIPLIYALKLCSFQRYDLLEMLLVSF